MRAGGRTRRRAVDAIVALVVIALVVAVLARARSNDPRRDETRRKSEPRRAGFERGGGGGGGDDAALRRAGTTETGIRERENGKRTVGARGARLGDADAHVLEPRGEGGEGGARKRAVSVELEEGKERRAARDSRDVPRGIRLKRNTSKEEELEEVPWPVRRSERRRLADPGGDEDGDGDGDGRRVYARRGKRFFGAERVFRGTRRFVRGGVRVVPRVLLLRRRVSRRGGLLRGLRAARDVRRSESLLSGSRGERRIERSAADELDGPRPSPGHVRVGRFRNASRRTDF